MTSTSDWIEKKVMLRAPRAQVWRALTKAEEFGSWFGVKLDSGFAPGKIATGNMTHPGYEHVKFNAEVGRMDAERLFSFRWHPYAIDPKVDYSNEPRTLVEFRLEDAPGGTSLTVLEAGFDRIPEGRRDEAFRKHVEGWGMQMENIRRHVER